MEQIGEAKIVKPLNDKREYKRVVLSNTLEVLLISDLVLIRQGMPNHSMGRLHFIRHEDLFQTKDCSWLSMVGSVLKAASALAQSVSGCRHFQMACISSAISMGSIEGGGGFGGTFDGTGGGGRGDGFMSHGGAAKSIVGDLDDVTSTAFNVIILDVGVIFLFL
eukprot:Gb_02651 [translate_table: standard]